MISRSWQEGSAASTIESTALPLTTSRVWSTPSSCRNSRLCHHLVALPLDTVEHLVGHDVNGIELGVDHRLDEMLHRVTRAPNA